LIIRPRSVPRDLQP